MTEWSDLVKKTFSAGRQNNPSYQLKDAMSDAKMVYKKQGGAGSCGLMKGGDGDDEEKESEECTNATTEFNKDPSNEDLKQAKIKACEEVELEGGKKKRTKKHHKKSKGGKKSKSHKKHRKGSRSRRH